MKKHVKATSYHKYRLRVLPRAVAFLILLTIVTGCGRGNSDSQGKTATSEASTPSSTNEASTHKSMNETTTSALTVTAIKEGAADAFVLISDEHVTLIDTGLQKKVDKLIDFLDKQQITYIDEIIITHFDKDHVGGAHDILTRYEVGEVYATYQSKESEYIDAYYEALDACGLEETVVTEELYYEADGISFTIYPPQEKSYLKKNSNNSSLVIRVVLGENSILFAGDAEEERIDELLLTEGLQSTILKVPHHGRLAENTKEFIEYIDPEYAIITSGTSEPEDPKVMDILEKCGVKTYLNREGNITINMSADEITISQ